ncbi:MAG: hypothetical protein ACI4SM_05200, partial [Candidatus Gastranaerophilaceae bacterium]
KANLQKPYTDEERENVIFNYGQNCFGKNPQTYEIKETETALEAWGKTNDDYAKEREEQFNKEFFNTSLGYIRRKVTMATGERKDFLSDLLPTISMGVQMGNPIEIITYNKPDFTQEITDWTIYQSVKTVNAEFIQECFLQLSNDFKPAKSEQVEGTSEQVNEQVEE